MNRYIYIILFSLLATVVQAKSKQKQPIASNIEVAEINSTNGDVRFAEMTIDYAYVGELNRTYIGSYDIPEVLNAEVKDNVRLKGKAEQIKVNPSSGNYRGGCQTEDYYVEISGASFGNGWDISSVTICGVEVCHIIMQSSNSVVVYPNAGNPGSGDIVITSKSKGKTTIEKGFTYLVKAPGSQAKNIQYSNVEASSIDVSWNRGSGESCVVFMQEANTILSTPSDQITYNSSSVFGDGSQIGSTGWFCVYNGNGSLVSVSGLVPGRKYIAQVFEYNGSKGYETYLISNLVDNLKIQIAEQ